LYHSLSENKQSKIIKSKNMKKLSILICTLLLVSTGVNAQKKGGKKSGAKSTPTRTVQRPTVQEPAEQKFRFGIRAGGNISKINGHDYSYIFSSKIGYFGGLVAKYSLSKKISLQGEAYYNMIGSKAKNQPEWEPFRVNSNIAYVSIPILVQYKIYDEFYVETGPELGINLSSKNKNLDTGKVFKMTDTKSTTFFWGIGTGYYITEDIAVNFRANIGLTTPFFETGVGGVDHFRMNNFQLGMIYLF
jgi:hypothetical protein